MVQLSNIPDFACAQLDTRWNETYMQLCSWVEERCAGKEVLQRLLPSQHSSHPREKRLGVWIKSPRAAAKHSKDRKLDAQRRPLLEAVRGWTWQQEKGAPKQFSDTRPNCKLTIKYDKSDTKDLNHEHDDGKGGKCRFRGVVIAGKIQANVRRNPWVCTGLCGQALSRNDFSAKMQNRKDGKVCKRCSNSKNK